MKAPRLNFSETASCCETLVTSKNTANAFAILFLAINPPLGVSATHKQSKHNFWSKMMKAVVPAKEEKNTPFP